MSGLPETINTALERHDLALLALAQGQLAVAHDHAQEALEALAHHLGRHHPDVAGAAETLATILHAGGSYLEAAAVARRGLEALGRLRQSSEDVELLRLRLVVLAAAIERDQGHLAAAQTLIVRGIRRARARLGATHPEVAQAQVALGAILKFRGRYEQAANTYQEAFDALAVAYGAEHPELAALYHNLGGLDHARGRFDSAEFWTRRSLELSERTFGPNHAQTAADLAALAAILDGQARFEESEPLYRRALEVFTALYGRLHYEVAINLSNLGAAQAARGQEAAALGCYCEALATLRTIAPDHPDVALVLHNLGALFEQRDHRDRAREHFALARDHYRRTLGDRHPATAASAARLAALS